MPYLPPMKKTAVDAVKTAVKAKTLPFGMSKGKTMPAKDEAKSQMGAAARKLKGSMKGAVKAKTLPAQVSEVEVKFGKKK